MKLFKINELYQVEIEPEVFMLEPFKKLRDDRLKKSKNNIDLVYKELCYIYFVLDLKSDFIDIADPKQRSKDVQKYLSLPSGWKADKLLQDCITAYKDLTSTVSSKLLRAAYSMAGKIENQLTNIDLDERKTNGEPMWDIKKITDTTKGLPSLMASIREAEQEFLKDEAINSKLKGDKVKTIYEDGFGKFTDN